MFYEYNILLNIHEYIHTCSILETYMSMSEIHLHEKVNPEKKFEKENHTPDWCGIDSYVVMRLRPDLDHSHSEIAIQKGGYSNE